MGARPAGLGRTSLALVDSLLLVLTFALGALLLWAIPGLTIRGALAYTMMLATIAAGFLVNERLIHKQSRDPQLAGPVN